MKKRTKRNRWPIIPTLFLPGTKRLRRKMMKAEGVTKEALRRMLMKAAGVTPK